MTVSTQPFHDPLDSREKSSTLPSLLTPDLITFWLSLFFAISVFFGKIWYLLTLQLTEEYPRPRNISFQLHLFPPTAPESYQQSRHFAQMPNCLSWLLITQRRPPQSLFGCHISWGMMAKWVCGGGREGAASWGVTQCINNHNFCIWVSHLATCEGQSSSLGRLGDERGCTVRYEYHLTNDKLYRMLTTTEGAFSCCSYGYHSLPGAVSALLTCWLATQCGTEKIWRDKIWKRCSKLLPQGKQPMFPRDNGTL